ERDADHAPGRAAAQDGGRGRFRFRFAFGFPAATESFAEQRIQLGNSLRPTQEGDPAQLNLARLLKPKVFLPVGDRGGGGGGELFVDRARFVTERRQV